MLTQPEPATKSLYDTDYHLWILETLRKLENKDFESLDLENLIEEVSDLSRREKRKLESLLTRLLEHLLKLKYWYSEKDHNQNHWQREIRNFRKQINRELLASPSLRSYLLEKLDELYQDARELVSDASGLSVNDFPPTAIANLEQILDENWLP